MSYILDALRRAEAERERGSVPGLHAQAPGALANATAGGAGRGAGWAPAAIAVLVAAVAVLAWRPWTTDQPLAAAPPVGEPAAPPARDAAAAAAGDATASPVRGAAASQTREAAAPATRDTPAPAARAVPDAPGVVAQRAPSPIVEPRRGAATVATAPLDVQRSPRSGAAEADSVAAPAEPRRVAVAASALPALPAASEPNVVALKDLPDDVRQQLPPLGVGGSIYSQNPASRFLMVNGQVMHEGDSIAPGLVLEQIRLKSAVLGFKGYRVGITF